MNKNILNTGVQEFISKNLKTDISSLLLKTPTIDGVSAKELAEQIESKNKSAKKLPTWFKTPFIYYPNKLNIEQTSSEETAAYKASLVSGNNLVDVTGGFGVDAYYFANVFQEVFHCEINPELSAIATHNFNVLNKENITSIHQNGVGFVERSTCSFDCIYVDPSRRDITKNKVFFLQDCSPDITVVLPVLFKKTATVLVKISPLIDISGAINDLKNISEIHIVAVNNEVKELLLFITKQAPNSSARIKTVNLKKNTRDVFNFHFEDEKQFKATYSLPMQYLYEPNAAVLKSGAFHTVSTRFNIPKLHVNTHLYTSDRLIDFPGRRFRIKNILPYNKKILKKELGTLQKANITTRNFPESVVQIRKKLKLKDGGMHYLFFCTDIENNKIAIITEKL